jgi:arsenate reductase
MEVFGLKTCDSCRKAMKSLADAELIDVRTIGVPDAVLLDAYKQFGSNLVNTRSTTWRGLDDVERARAPLELLRDHPALMKRPLIRAQDGSLYLGWTAKTQQALGVSG